MDIRNYILDNFLLLVKEAPLELYKKAITGVKSAAKMLPKAPAARNPIQAAKGFGVKGSV